MPRYFSTSSGCSRTASENEPKMTPTSFSFSLKVVATLDAVEDRVHRDPGQARALVQGHPQLLVGLEQLGVDLVQALRPVLLRLGAE